MFQHKGKKLSGGASPMTLHDLTEQLSPTFPPSVQKDLKTAVRVLAQALSYADAKSCPLHACLQPLPELYHTVEAHLTAQGKSPHTIRNTKNNLSRLFRLAETLGLFTLLPATLTQRFNFDDVPHRPHAWTPRDGSHLMRHDWPAEVEAEFTAFSKWATDPFVLGREATWKKRPTTIKGYQKAFEAYFGYLHHTLQIRPVQFSHLFDYPLIERFVHWHINDKWHRSTAATRNLIRCIHAMTSQYRPDATLKASLTALGKRLPPYRPLLNKSDAWLPLQELERVGLALWPSKSPEVLASYLKSYQSRQGLIGYKMASRAGLSLMLRLWVHIPYRQRNMREMKLDQNLYRTPEGQWRIRFAGEQLKIATKRGQPNIFDLPFPPTLVPTLDTYLRTWRPILTRRTNAAQVFLNQRGEPFTQHAIATTVQGHIYSFTGLRWHPHMIRTTWATEWIKTHGDFMTAAIMLNDRLDTVIKSYAHLLEENVAEKAFEWVQNRVNGH
jgi:hypothetical protein